MVALYNFHVAAAVCFDAPPLYLMHELADTRRQEGVGVLGA